MQRIYNVAGIAIRQAYGRGDFVGPRIARSVLHPTFCPAKAIAHPSGYRKSKRADVAAIFQYVSGRNHAWRIVEAEKTQMDRVRFLSLSGVSPMRKLIAQHKAIVTTVRKNKVDAAEKAVRKHLSEVLAALPPIAEEHPELFDDTDFLRQHGPSGETPK